VTDFARPDSNFGDCFAKALNEPLLFKGDDVRDTDTEAAAILGRESGRLSPTTRFRVDSEDEIIRV
jgi:hypothetical protein